MHGRRDLRIEVVARPDPGPGELLVQVTAAGVCGTDAHQWADGPTMMPLEHPHPDSGHSGPTIPGHEFGGVVVAVGDRVDGVDVGDLVSSGSGVSCGSCPSCRLGRTNLCGRYWTVGLHRNGGLAEFVAVPASVCLEVGSMGITRHAAALVQPMSIAVHAARRGRPQAGMEAVVVGAGGVGAFVVFALASWGSEVDVVEPDPARRDLALGLGARRAIAPLDAGGLSAGLVYEVSGSPGGLEVALGVVSPGGRLVAVGLQQGPRPIDLRTLSLSEREIVGTNAHVFAEDFPEAARLVAARKGWSDVAPSVVPLTALPADAFPALAAGKPARVKTLVDPGAAVERQAVT